jgi:aldehyde:ferredoxin oxidoreductase
MARIDGGSPAIVAPYSELQFKGYERYEYKSKGPASATVSCYWQVGSCAGVCLFPVIFFGNYPLLDFLNAVTGWGMDMAEALEAGARIQTLRQAFNLREGISPHETKLPHRMAGVPPKSEGPLAGITIDIDSLASEYRRAMGWDPDTGYPTEATLERLGLKEFTETYRK